MFRIKYKEKDLQKMYNNIVSEAELYFNKKRYIRSLSLISNAATFEYCINSVYSDYRLSILLKKISERIYPNRLNCEKFLPDRGCVLFYDSISEDNRGLTQQYIDGLSNSGKTIVYVSEKGKSTLNYDIYKQLREVKAITFELPEFKGLLNKSNKLREIIQEYSISLAFFHLKPNSIIPFVALYNSDNITKYQINITDHAFWLGDSVFFDFLLEFRDYGCTTSIKKRNFPVKKILKLPYYPWISNTTFGGFPEQAIGKFIFFAGGSLYKIDDYNNSFLKIVNKILNINENIIFLYAGDGNRSNILNYVSQNNLENRFFLLGNRKDINEVVKRIDVFLDTYPLPGGLMSQYAAINGKPILAYNNREIEKIVGTKKFQKFVHYSVDSLVIEARRLFEDRAYYLKRKEFFQSLVLGKSDFDKNISLILSGISPMQFEQEDIDFDEFCSQYIERINMGSLQSSIELLAIRSSFSNINFKTFFNLFFNFKYLFELLKKSLGA